MKKIFYISSVIAVFVFVATVIETNAQTITRARNNDIIAREAEVEVEDNDDNQNKIDSVREKLRANNTQQYQNPADKEDLRDRVLGQKIATTTQKRLIVREIRMDAFMIRYNSLIRQLNLSVSNLEQVIQRITDRISKAETSGRDMDKAKELLVISKSKITTAKAKIQLLADMRPATTTIASASTTISLEKPREMGEDAINAIKEAKESLVAVVRAIAHAMGLGASSIINATTTSTSTTQ